MSSNQIIVLICMISELFFGLIETQKPATMSFLTAAFDETKERLMRPDLKQLM